MAREMHKRVRGIRAADTRWAWVPAALVVAALVAWAVAAWVDDSEGSQTDASVSEVADEPSDFFGERVTVSGEVVDVAPRAAVPGRPGVRSVAFTLGGNEMSEQILVVDVRAGGFPFITEDSVVEVTGTVREFDSGGFTEDFGTDLFEEEWFGEFGARPVILATAVDPTVPTADGAA